MIYKNLFIFNFKEWKKYGKRLLKVICAVVLCSVLTDGLNYMYVNAEQDAWNRIVWHNYYEEKENIDYLYLGSSHVYLSLNPVRLDELNGKNNFNLATSSQRLNGSYYLLREADKEHDLEHVFVELYYQYTIGRHGRFLSERAGRMTNWRNTDYMKNSLNRLEYMLSMSTSEYYVDSFFPFVRYREKLFDLDYIRKQIAYKKSEDYLNYSYMSERGEYAEEYRDKGYYYSTVELQPNSLMCVCDGEKWESEPMTEEAEKYLRDIIEYCQDKGIKVTFFSAPMYDLQLLQAEWYGGYDTYVKQVQSIVAEYGVDYYDFNLCKETYLPMQGLEDYRDLHHLNSKGAEKFTEVFYQVMQGTKEENEQYFYQSYEEKRQETEGKVYGLLQLSSDEKECLYKIASNWEEGLEYKILLTPHEEETAMFQDFSENQEFVVPTDEHGKCTIIVRQSGGKKETQTIEITY